MKDERNDLKFPVFDEPQVTPKRLSMEEYARFVQFGWEHAVRREEQIERRLKTGPTVRFTLDDCPGGG